MFPGIFQPCLIMWLIGAGMALVSSFFLKTATLNKYADEINHYPERKEKLIKMSTQSVRMMKLGLWTTPILMILLLLMGPAYLEIDLWVAIATPVLLAAIMVQELIYRKKLLTRLQREV
jgi:hypothetical protein